jgi:hypothetical protein
MIRFSCGACGKPMQAKTEFVGKTTRCPGCQAPVVIADPNQATADARPGGYSDHRPAPPPAPVPVSAVPPPPPPMPAGERPRRGSRGKKGGVPVWPFLLVGGLLLLGALAVGAWFIFGGGGVSEDVALLPSDAHLFYSVKVSDLWNSESIKPFRDELPLEAQAGIKLFEEKLGVGINDIERVAFTINVDKSEMLGTLMTTKAIDKKKILAAIEQGGEKPDEKTAGGKTYYVMKTNANNGPNPFGGGLGPGGMGGFPAMKPPESVAFTFYTDKIMLAGNTEAVERILKDGPSKTRGPLYGAMTKASRNSFVMGINLTGDGMKNMMMAGAANPFGGGKDLSADIKGILVAVNITKTLELETTATFSSDGKASDAKKEAQSAIDQAKQSFPLMKGMMAAQDADMGKLMDAVDKGLSSISVSQSGKDVTVKFRMDIPVEAIKNLAKKGGPNKMGGPPRFGGGPRPF